MGKRPRGPSRLRDDLNRVLERRRQLFREQLDPVEPAEEWVRLHDGNVLPARAQPEPRLPD